MTHKLAPFYEIFCIYLLTHVKCNSILQKLDSTTKNLPLAWGNPFLPSVKERTTFQLFHFENPTPTHVEDLVLMPPDHNNQLVAAMEQASGIASLREELRNTRHAVALLGERQADRMDLLEAKLDDLLALLQRRPARRKESPVRMGDENRSASIHLF